MTLREQDRARGRGGSRRGPRGGRRAGSARVDAQLPERVAVAGAADGAVHTDVAATAGDVEGLDATGAGGGGVDRCPVGGVRRGLDLERLSIGGFPVEDHLADLSLIHISEPTRLGMISYAV